MLLLKHFKWFHSLPRVVLPPTALRAWSCLLWVCFVVCDIAAYPLLRILLHKHFKWFHSLPHGFDWHITPMSCCDFFPFRFLLTFPVSSFPASVLVFFFLFYFLCLFCLWFSTSLEVRSAEMLDLFMRLVNPIFCPRAWYKIILPGKMFLLFLASAAGFSLLDLLRKAPLHWLSTRFCWLTTCYFPLHFYCHSTPVEVCRSMLPSRSVAGDECVVLHIVSSGLVVLRSSPVQPNATAVSLSLSLYLYIWCHNS
jgi:hypothetical protein